MPFSFTNRIRELMADIAATCPELRQVDLARVAVAFAQTRHGRLDGVFASIHPLRFPGGERTARRPRGTYEMPRVLVNGAEMLYVIEFRLPRFQNLPFEEKLATIIHEMYHISPRFDGTLRRFEGGKPYHTGSRRRYDAAMARMARSYLAATTRPELHAFLRLDFRQLSESNGGVVGLRFRHLRLRRIG